MNQKDDLPQGPPPVGSGSFTANNVTANVTTSTNSSSGSTSNYFERVSSHPLGPIAGMAALEGVNGGGGGRLGGGSSSSYFSASGAGGQESRVFKPLGGSGSSTNRTEGLIAAGVQWGTFMKDWSRVDGGGGGSNKNNHHVQQGTSSNNNSNSSINNLRPSVDDLPAPPTALDRLRFNLDTFCREVNESRKQQQQQQIGMESSAKENFVLSANAVATKAAPPAPPLPVTDLFLPRGPATDDPPLGKHGERGEGVTSGDDSRPSWSLPGPPPDSRRASTNNDPVPRQEQDLPALPSHPSSGVNVGHTAAPSPMHQQQAVVTPAIATASGHGFSFPAMTPLGVPLGGGESATKQQLSPQNVSEPWKTPSAPKDSPIAQTYVSPLLDPNAYAGSSQLSAFQVQVAALNTSLPEEPQRQDQRVLTAVVPEIKEPTTEEEQEVDDSNGCASTKEVSPATTIMLQTPHTEMVSARPTTLVPLMDDSLFESSLDDDAINNDDHRQLVGGAPAGTGERIQSSVSAPPAGAATTGQVVESEGDSEAPAASPLATTVGWPTPRTAGQTPLTFGNPLMAPPIPLAGIPDAPPAGELSRPGGGGGGGGGFDLLPPPQAVVSGLNGGGGTAPSSDLTFQDFMLEQQNHQNLQQKAFVRTMVTGQQQQPEMGDTSSRNSGNNNDDLPARRSSGKATRPPPVPAPLRHPKVKKELLAHREHPPAPSFDYFQGENFQQAKERVSSGSAADVLDAGLEEGGDKRPNGVNIPFEMLKPPGTEEDQQNQKTVLVNDYHGETQEIVTIEEITLENSGPQGEVAAGEQQQVEDDGSLLSHSRLSLNGLLGGGTTAAAQQQVDGICSLQREGDSIIHFSGSKREDDHHDDAAPAKNEAANREGDEEAPPQKRARFEDLPSKTKPREGGGDQPHSSGAEDGKTPSKRARPSFMAGTQSSARKQLGSPEQRSRLSEFYVAAAPISRQKKDGRTPPPAARSPKPQAQRSAAKPSHHHPKPTVKSATPAVAERLYNQRKRAGHGQATNNHNSSFLGGASPAEMASPVPAIVFDQPNASFSQQQQSTNARSRSHSPQAGSGGGKFLRR